LANEPSVNIEWGTTTSAVNFKASAVNPLRYVEQFPPRHFQDAQHDSRVGINTLVIDDLSGGLWDSATIGDWRKDKHHVWYNEGIQCHVPGVAALPYKATNQTTLISADFSGYNAANKRVHGINYNQRWYACLGPYLVKDTSTSSPVLIVPSTNDNITDNVGAIGDCKFNSTRCLTIGAMDGTTDGVRGTTDPTANSITWTQIFTYTSGDSCWGLLYIRDLSINVLIGTFSGINMVGYVYDTDALLTMPTPFDLSTSVNPTSTTYATNQTFATVGANNTGIGTIAWSNPTNINSGLDGSFATVLLDDNEVSNYLYADTFGFALASTDLVVGVECMVFAKSDTPAAGNLADMNYKSVRLFNASAALFGEDQAIGSPPDVTPITDVVQASVFGGQTSMWGEALTPTIVNDADFGVGVAFEKSGATGGNATISVDAIALTVWYQRGLTLQSVTKSVGNYTQRTAQSEYFVSLSNITASDDADTTATWQTGAGADDVTTQIWTYGYGFSLPRNAIISGIVATVERAESNAAGNADDSTIQLMQAFTAVGDNKQQSNNLEYSTTDESVSYGSATDVWGTTWTAANINNPGFGLIVQANLDANALTFDHISITVYWYMPLSVLSFPTGGGPFFTLPNNSHRIVGIVPERTNDPTAITEKRVLAYFDIASVGVGSISYPETGLSYAGLACPYLGGVAVAGGGKSNNYNQVVIVGSDGLSRDLGFPAVVNHPSSGSVATKITQMFAVNDVLIVDTCGLDPQRWLYHDGKWHASWAQQSKAQSYNLITPLYWAETPYPAGQGFVYRFIPVDATSLSVTREFVPPDPFNDPHLTNTAVVKQDGPLYVQVVQLDCGPPEMLKTLTQVTCQSLRIDDDTSYGSLRVLVDTGRDTAITSAEVDITFNAVAETFVDSTIKTSLDPGVTFDTLCIRLIGDHEAASAETPNLLPVLFTFVSQWPAYEEVSFVLPADQQHEPLQNILSRLATLQNTKNVQRLLGAGYDKPMAWLPERTQIKFKPRSSTTLSDWQEIESAVITFRVVPGATA